MKRLFLLIGLGLFLASSLQGANNDLSQDEIESLLSNQNVWHGQYYGNRQLGWNEKKFIIHSSKKYLFRAYKDGSDIEARGHMLVGSSMGSTAFQKGLGAIHSLSHPVGAIYNTHPGLTNAVFMPYVLKRNREKIEEKLTSISRYIGLSNPGYENFLNWILELRKSLNIPHTLKDLIEEDSNLEKMSDMALNDPSTGGNPTKLLKLDFLNLYKDSFEGIL